ncbi:protein madd-4 [Belonocnema kinseyi]|uniref:protein madd-4 n=1 Tax=Belonocnema kinseyi TaxID=2817044 RepID=UPI00143CCDC3|nr:protein madd-4 [Belonocnema kinseyi]
MASGASISAEETNLEQDVFSTPKEEEKERKGLAWGEWSHCTRSCDGGISRQQRRCRKKPCKGKPWSMKYKLCNTQPCENPSNYRAEQCTTFDNVPYGSRLLKWFPYYDSTRPCSLICRGEQSLDDISDSRNQKLLQGRVLTNEDEYITSIDSEEIIIVQLAEKVKDGTRCRPESLDVCIGGECLKVGCDLKIGSNKKTDACGVCGGNGSSCHGRYSWVLEPASACTELCGGGYKIATAICKTVGPDETVTDDSNCDQNIKPEKVLVPCNTHSCTTKWIANEWSKCSATCGGGSRTRSVFCTEENGNETTKLPDYKCSATHKPRYQETCNAFSCPMWETGQWSDCSVSCGTGMRTRLVECRDGNGRFSEDCDSEERPRGEQECKASRLCSSYDHDLNQPLMQAYPPAPISEKLIDQPIPSESTFIAEQWSPCSVTCGEGIRHREVHCKIFLEFSKTIAKLPDRQCSGPKPIDTEKCMMEPCGLLENSLSYRIDTVGDSGYAESSLTDSYRSSGGSSGPGSYEGNMKVASGSSILTTYSWHEDGFTHCSATCLGGVQTSIIHCRRDDTNKVVTPLLCSPEMKPKSRSKACNDHPCPPKWNTTDFSPCMSPCGLGIQTRDVTCIHEVTRGTGNTVAVPSHMCPQPPPVDRRYCNVFDCPVKWHLGEWGKCSKTCGGGTKTRKVACEQIRAQGRKQERPENECPSHKPTSEKPCNTRACSDMDMSEQPIILSQNITFSQDDPSDKVDLKIGGTAVVFQGTPVVKIRCPVKKFDKKQIIWTKDRSELRRSRKHKISQKGALRIIDITYTDKGIYSCIAGHTQAEMHLLVKVRPRDQMSSEEVLRSGNAIHTRQGVNLISSPINSGENVNSDGAGSETQFRYGSDDLSHEARPDGQGLKPTEKTRKKPKRPKTTTPPIHLTKPDPGYAVTAIHQFDSIESNAASSASTLVPPLSQLISTLKTYWPFKDTPKSNTNQRPLLLEDINFETKLTTRAISKLNKDFRYDNLHKDNRLLQRNTVIPDEPFEPDEEKIFIDDDPFDMGEVLTTIDHRDSMRIIPELAFENHFSTPLTVSMINHVDRSPRHNKHDERIQNNLRNQRGTILAKEKKDSVLRSREDNLKETATVEAYHETRTKTRNWSDRKFEDFITTFAPGDDERVKTQEGIQESVQVSLQAGHDQMKTASSTPSEESLTEENTIQTENISEKSNEFYETELEVEKHFHGEKTLNDSSFFVKNDTESSDELENNKENLKEEKELELLRRSGSKEEKNNNISTSFKDLERASKSYENLVTLSTSLKKDPANQPTIGPVVVFSKAKDDLIFEWVTTEWSRCSQTCGGGGFQMRGAQCTVRSVKAAANSTRSLQRTVIGANLCEDAGYPVPEKVKPCGTGRCPQWHADEWTPCESSRCFNWRTAMQRRDITCHVIEEMEDGTENVTIADSSKCDEGVKPPQRQECYNDACKGVWRVGEWSECTAPCEEDGIKYRILQCVWFGTKKPAGNACRDLSRPPVMKTCRGLPCPRSPEDCKDLSQLCKRVKIMNMCQVPLYKKQCCLSCSKSDKKV